MRESADSNSCDLKCPRCGYDLRGVTSTWTEVCPLDGRCSECGLDFEWRKVFSYAQHPWLFEHYWKRRPIFSFFRTLWAAARPWVLWRNIDLFIPVRLMILTILFIGSFGLGAAYRYVHLFVDGFRWGRVNMPIDLPSDRWFPTNYWMECLYGTIGSMVFTPVTSSILLWCFLMPILFALLPDTLRQARVRHVHLVRIAVYSIIVILPIAIVLETFYWTFWWDLEPMRGAFEEIMRRLARVLLFPINRVFGMRGFSFSDVGQAMFPLLVGVYFSWYWWLAARRYLRLPSAGRVVLIETVVAGLIVFSAVMAFQGV